MTVQEAWERFAGVFRTSEERFLYFKAGWRAGTEAERQRAVMLAELQTVQEEDTCCNGDCNQGRLCPRRVGL
jgi:hypothetical protein